MLLTITGPSGSGKTELIKKLTGNGSPYSLLFSEMISVTTRSPRPGEIDGVDYVFVTKNNFHEKESRSEFLETVSFNGNFYGTLKEDVLKCLAGHKIPTIICEPAGILHFEAFCNENDIDLVSAFINASPEKLIARYLKRMGEKGLATPDALEYNAKRLTGIVREQETWEEEYDYDMYFINNSDDIKAISHIASSIDGFIGLQQCQ